jgi:2-(1,2-epoxy-1,2-dihydrophenyl)acetyl-CoA isomerase
MSPYRGLSAAPLCRDDPGMTDAIEQTVLTSLEGGILRLTLNKPDAANAISQDQRNHIIGLLQEADNNPEVRVIVLGANGKHFCSGADVRGMASTMAAPRLAGATIRTLMQGAQRLIAAVLDCGKPVIAAVQGPAAGMGCHLALACDLIVAVDTAWFSQPFVLRGLSLDAAGAYLLPRRLGLQKAKEMAFLGDRMSADEAKMLGLVNIVASEAEFAGEVDKLAARLAAGATMAISLSKRLLNGSLDQDRNAAFLAEAMAQEIVGATLDSTEGVMSFLEKRPSSFKGH